MIAACWPYAPKYFQTMDEVRAFAKEKNKPIHISIILENESSKLIKVWPDGKTEDLRDYMRSLFAPPVKEKMVINKEQRLFLEKLNRLLPSNKTVDALAPDRGPNKRPYHQKRPLTGDEIIAFRLLFDLSEDDKE